MKFRIVTACALMLTACAGSNATRNSRDAAPSQNADFIMAEELAGTNGSTAYDAVRQLRRFAQRFGISALIDRESRRFGELGLRSAMLSEERWLEKLSIEPLLLRMPLVRNQHQLTIGAAPEIWNAWYAAAKS